MAGTRTVFALLLFGVVIACVPRDIRAEGNSGRQTPGFSLTGIDGKTLDSSDYRGKVVLLDFWATWCVPCQTEIPRFVAFQKKYGAQGFQVVGISMDDSTEPVQHFYTKFNMNYPVALGNATLADQFGGVLGLPLTFLISRDGTIVKQYDGKANLDKMEEDIRLLLRSDAKKD